MNSRVSNLGQLLANTNMKRNRHCHLLKGTGIIHAHGKILTRVISLNLIILRPAIVYGPGALTGLSKS